MNNGNHNHDRNGAAATAQPSVMRYRKLLSRKSYFGLKNADIARAAKVCVVTVSRFLNGDDGVRPEIQDAIVGVLRMRRVVDFEPVEIDRGFADTVAGAGVKYSTRYEPSRNVWLTIQESAFESHPVGEFYGIESERMARFNADRLNEAVGAR